MTPITSPGSVFRQEKDLPMDVLPKSFMASFWNRAKKGSIHRRRDIDDPREIGAPQLTGEGRPVYF
jgi:hypothetical protein